MINGSSLFAFNFGGADCAAHGIIIFVIVQVDVIPFCVICGIEAFKASRVNCIAFLFAVFYIGVELLRG